MLRFPGTNGCVLAAIADVVRSRNGRCAACAWQMQEECTQGLLVLCEFPMIVLWLKKIRVFDRGQVNIGVVFARKPSGLCLTVPQGSVPQSCDNSIRDSERRRRILSGARRSIKTLLPAIPASAADLKFLHHMRQSHFRNFKSKSGTRIMTLLKHDDFSSNRHPALASCLSMIFSENRFPLFGIML